LPHLTYPLHILITEDSRGKPLFGGWHPKDMGNLNLRIFIPQNSMSTLKILSLEAQYPKRGGKT